MGETYYSVEWSPTSTGHLSLRFSISVKAEGNISTGSASHTNSTVDPHRAGADSSREAEPAFREAFSLRMVQAIGSQLPVRTTHIMGGIRYWANSHVVHQKHAAVHILCRYKPRGICVLPRYIKQPVSPSIYLKFKTFQRILRCFFFAVIETYVLRTKEKLRVGSGMQSFKAISVESLQKKGKCLTWTEQHRCWFYLGISASRRVSSAVCPLGSDTCVRWLLCLILTDIPVIPAICASTSASLWAMFLSPCTEEPGQ